MLPCVFCAGRYYHSTLYDSMPHMPNSHDSKNMDNGDAITPLTPNMWVTLSAGALSSFGFGLSIFVMWFRWFVPSSMPTPAPVTTQTVTNALRTRRRKSVPLPARVGTWNPPNRRATAPVISGPTTSVEDDSALRNSKRVYFVDPTLVRIRDESDAREVSSVEQGLVEGESLAQPQAQPQPLVPPDISPSTYLSSTSTLVVNPIHVEVANVDLNDEPVVDSDSSSRRSLSKRLSKMKCPLIGKARRQSANAEKASPARTNISLVAPPSAAQTLDGTQPDVPSLKSCRLPFGRRNSKPAASSILVPPSDSVPAKSGPCKRHRRSSTATPIPRTSPYEAPYFAAPPSLFDANHMPRPKRPSSGNAVGLRSGSNHISEQENNRPSPGNLYNEAQVLLGHERPQSTAKRRSTSDSFPSHRRTNSIE